MAGRIESRFLELGNPHRLSFLGKRSSEVARGSAIEDLIGGLREIRDAASKLSVQKWSAAAELDRVLHDQAARVAAIYELSHLNQDLKTSITSECLKWDSVYRQAVASPSQLEFQETAFAIADKLVMRINRLLALLHAPIRL